MKVITNNDDVILGISNTAVVVSNGVRLDDYIIPVAVENGVFVQAVPNIYDVTTAIDVDVAPVIYCYTPTKGFYLNPQEQKKADAVEELQSDQAQIILALVTGGLM